MPATDHVGEPIAGIRLDKLAGDLGAEPFACRLDSAINEARGLDLCEIACLRRRCVDSEIGIHPTVHDDQASLMEVRLITGPMESAIRCSGAIDADDDPIWSARSRLAADDHNRARAVADHVTRCAAEPEGCSATVAAGADDDQFVGI